MDFSAKFEDLQRRVADAKAAAQAAAIESRDQLKQRIHQAQDDVEVAVEDTKQQAGVAVDEARSKWAQQRGGPWRRRGGQPLRGDHRRVAGTADPDRALLRGHDRPEPAEARIVASAAVAIDAAQIKGVLRLPLASLRATLPAFKNPANKHRAVTLTRRAVPLRVRQRAHRGRVQRALRPVGRCPRRAGRLFEADTVEPRPARPRPRSTPTTRTAARWW